MKKFLLFISDTTLLFLSLLLTLYLRYGQSNTDWQFDLHIIPFSLIFIVWLIVFYIANLYEPSTLRNNIHFYSSLLQTIVVSTVISIMIFYLIPLFRITPKTNLLIFVAIFAGLEFSARSTFNQIFEKKFKRSLLIVGLNKQAFELSQFIKNNPQLGYDLKYVVDLSSENSPISKDGSGEEFKKFGIIQGLNNLEKTIKSDLINTVVISPEAYQIPETIDIFYKSLEQKISFFNLASFYERITGKVPLGAINQIWFLENLSEGKKRGYELMKRVGDVIFGLLFGAISLVFYPFIIIAMQIDSPGPIFYKQTRIGQMGKIFKLIKFRNMIPNAEAKTGAVWTSENDPRITRIGSFLRKTRLDEIPQLWTVVKGEMSLVGPRAERPEFHDILKRNIPFYEERYLIKPGLTGWAQINFHYGSSIKDAAEKLKYDLYYIKNRSLLLDLGIVLKTIRIALKQAGR